MKSYSLGRVAQYARYHYVSNMKHYFSMVAAMVLVPVVFGILARDVETVTGICAALYLFSGFIFSVRTTYAMRDRVYITYSKIMTIFIGRIYRLWSYHFI